MTNEQFVDALEAVHSAIASAALKIDLFSLFEQENAANSIFEAAILSLDRYNILNDKTGLFIPSRFDLKSGTGGGVLESSSCFFYSSSKAEHEIYERAYKSFVNYYVGILLQANIQKGMAALLQENKLLQDMHCITIDRHAKINKQYTRLDVDNLQKMEKKIFEETISVIAQSNFSSISKLDLFYNGKLMDLNDLVLFLSKNIETSSIIFNRIKYVEKLINNKIDSFSHESLYMIANLCDYMFMSNLLYTYYFPSIVTNAQSDQSTLTAPGVLVLSTDKPLDDLEIRFLKILSSLIWTAISQIDLIRLEKKADISARKAAVIQYVARNLDHNIGSHVIPETTLYFGYGDFSDVKRKEYIYSNKYIEERMDLIAQLSSMKGKYDSANYNLAELIDRLNESVIPKGLCDLLSKPSNKKITITVAEESKGHIAALPNGIVGVQALFVIIENIIRNAYKHSQPLIEKTYKKYEIFINISNSSHEYSDFWQIDIYDNLGKPNQTFRKDSEVIDKLNGLINQPVLTPDAQLQDRGWGIMEMKSAVAFLVGHPLEQLDELNTAYGKPMFEALYYPDREGYNNLGYRFYLRKPSLLLIDEALPIAAKLQQQPAQLQAKGIRIGSPLSLQQEDQSCQFVMTAATLPFDNRCIIPPFELDVAAPITAIEAALWKACGQCREYPATQLITQKADLGATSAGVPAYFDNHGKTLSLWNGKPLSKINPDQFKKLKLPFYQPYRTASGLTEFIHQLQDNPEGAIKYQLIAAVHTRVLVLDERIQKAVEALDNNQPKLKIRHLLAGMGVDVPEFEDIDLSDFLENPSDDIRAKILCKMKDYQYHYVIIHLTLLEKIANTTRKDKLQQFIRDEAANGIEGLDEEQTFTAKKRALVLASGRGDPPNLPTGSYYLNYTTLYDCLIFRMSKLHLLFSLNALRKR